MIKEYQSTITVSWGCNNHEAKSKEEYIQKVKDQFYEEFGIHLTDNEITDIEQIN
tara:strand:- start:352 stop:516 length:165 start_codon:yes stop_codon:yes gene_type:complete